VKIQHRRNADGSKVYFARPVIDGKREWVKGGTMREVREQVEALEAQKQQRRLGLPPKLGPITFDELADKFLAQYQFSYRSKRGLIERLRYAREGFGDVLVRDITPETVATWNANLRKKPKKGQKGEPGPLSPTSKHNALLALRQAFTYGIDTGYADVNPTKIKAPGPGRRDKQPFESWAEVFTVAEKAGKYGPLIRFACTTGLRTQEWRAVEWRHIDFTKRELRVEQTVRDVDGRDVIVATAKTDGSLRTVALSGVAIEALREARGERIATGLIFEAPEGGLINLANWRRRAWKKALTDAKLTHRSPDQMRHTFATLSLAGGVPIEWVSEQLGHVNIQTTIKHYARWLPTAHSRNLAVLDASITEALGAWHKSATDEDAADA
jgi:integrase